MPAAAVKFGTFEAYLTAVLVIMSDEGASRIGAANMRPTAIFVSNHGVTAKRWKRYQ